MTIRRAGPADAALLGRIHALSWQGAYRGIATDAYLAAFTPERRTAYFERILPTTVNEHYILYRGATPVGMMAIGPNGEDVPGAKACGEIHALHILPEHTGHGVGRQAMAYALSRLRTLGFADVVVVVLSENTRALRFYGRYGFVPDGPEEPFFMGRDAMERRYRLPAQATS